jgi:hypothetical protein
LLRGFVGREKTRVKEECNDGCLWCMWGGSAVPADRDFPGCESGEERIGQSETQAGPNPYTRATKGQKKRDPKQPKRGKKKRGVGGWEQKERLDDDEKS